MVYGVGHLVEFVSVCHLALAESLRIAMPLLKWPLPKSETIGHSVPTGVIWCSSRVLLLHIWCWGDRQETVGPIVTCSNAAPPSRRGYNVPLDRSRGFRRSRHSSDGHTCPLLPLDCWRPVSWRVGDLVVLDNHAGPLNCWLCAFM